METDLIRPSCWVKGLAVIAIIFSLFGLLVAAFPCICRGIAYDWIFLEAIALALGIVVVAGRSEKWMTMIIISIVISLSYFGTLTADDYRERKSLEPSSCRSNLRSLGVSMSMYCQENNDRFPPPEKWSDNLSKYTNGEITFLCPSQEDRTRPSYAMNEQLKGLRCEDVVDPEHTVFLFESKPGKNMHGGPELLADKPPHYERYNVLFLDDQAKILTRSEILKLNWDPKKKCY